MQFWLDVVAEWKNEQHIGTNGTRRNPIIVLSATKDVQDAILGDGKRQSLVDVIDFRYW